MRNKIISNFYCPLVGGLQKICIAFADQVKLKACSSNGDRNQWISQGAEQISEYMTAQSL